ncbi:uncharacterized protein LOC143553032 [Bidens hawaiensis]|uniref:uncharacterized protein LOC143553032 n=1 Tax=Bidens hawaiensis TaxID=980011 RepID=UPI0040496EB7
MEIQDFRSLLNLFEGVHMGSNRDRLLWGLNEHVGFTVKSVKDKLEEIGYSRSDFAFMWNEWVPKKVSILAWHVGLERLPTLVELAKGNVNFGSDLCPFCGDHAETVEHLFVSCSLGQDVSQILSMWCGLPSVYAFSVRDFLIYTGRRVSVGRKQRFFMQFV